MRANVYEKKGKKKEPVPGGDGVGDRRLAIYAGFYRMLVEAKAFGSLQTTYQISSLWSG